MYQNQRLNGFLPGLTSRVSSIAKSAVKVAVAPLAIAKTAIQGGSIGGAIEDNVLKPSMSTLHVAAPVLPFIPVIGNIATGLVALDTLRLAKQQARNDARQEAAIQAEIDRVQARIKELQTGSGAMTANASAGIQTAAIQQNALTDQPAQPETKKPLNWGAIASGAVVALTLLK